MAFISIQPSDYFSTKRWTGTGSEQSLNTGFQPDLVWSKGVNNTHTNMWWDSVRGATKRLESSNTDVESTVAEGVKSFDSTGFTVGTDNGVNQSTNTFVSWNWKAGTTSVPSGGTITPSAVSYSAASGFGMYKYGGNSTDAATIAHGLGVRPDMIIIKCTSSSRSWAVGSHPVDWTDYGNLDATDPFYDNDGYWSDDEPTSTLFTLGTDGLVNTSGETYIAYVFANVKGMTKVGSYSGNGDSDGPFIYTGFKPAFVMWKVYNGGSGGWILHDDKRPGYNVTQQTLWANLDMAQDDNVNRSLDFCATGFKIRGTDTDTNYGGRLYTYVAMAQYPVVSSNSKSGVAG